MFWRESKRIKIAAFCFTIISLQGCSSDTKKNQSPSEAGTNNEVINEDRLVRQIENELDISAVEKYDIQIIPEYINPDTLQDKLILINRKEFAYKHAKGTNSEHFFEKTGHTGPYNYVFVQLGGERKLLSTTPVGSNADYLLNAEFLTLTSKAQKDFYVDYRIKNSLQRNYYTIQNKRIYLTFSCPIFDSIGSADPIVYDIEHKESPVRISKDIILNKGKFIDYNPNEIKDTFNYEPKGIISTGELFVYFIFDNKRMKYVTPMSHSQK